MRSHQVTADRLAQQSSLQIVLVTKWRNRNVLAVLLMYRVAQKSKSLFTGQVHPVANKQKYY